MKTFCKLTEAEFDAFSRDYRPTNFLQSVPMAHSQQERGSQIAYYGIRDGSGLVVAAGLFTLTPYRKFFRIASAFGGMLMDYSNEEDLVVLYEGLRQEFSHSRVAQVRILPYFNLIERDIDGKIVEAGYDNHDLVDNLNAAGFQHHGYQNHYNTTDSRWFFQKDLSQITTPEELLASFGGQNRWATRKTQKLGIQVRDLRFDELDQFDRILEHTADRRDFLNRGIDYYRSIYQGFVPSGEARFLLAELDLDHYQAQLGALRQEQLDELRESERRYASKPTGKMENRIRTAREAIEGFDAKLSELETDLRPKGPVIPLAAAVFLRYVDTVTYLFSGAYSEYLHFNAAYAIQWEAMNWALEQKATLYDFYGTEGAFSGAEDEGVYHFKKGFGGFVVEKPGIFSLNPNPTLYKFLSKVSDIDEE